MATPANQLDQLIATTYDNYRSTLADNITKKVALLTFLESKSRITEDGGLTIRVPLMHALNNTVKSYSGYDILDTTAQGGLGMAEYNWRQYAGSVTISGEEELKNAGSSQIISLLQAKFDQLQKSFVTTLSDHVWATSVGNGGKDVLSIPVIVKDTGVLGGIDPATETWWKATSSAAAVSLATLAGVKGLSNMYNSLDVEGSRPDIEFTTQAIYEAYEQLAAADIRFQKTSMADLGFQSIAHKAAELVFEQRVPANHVFFLNSDHLSFVQHSQRWMQRQPFMQPYNQDARTALVLSMGQLITDERRAHGVLTNVTA